MIQDIKNKVCQKIDEHAEQLINFAKQTELSPELG
jgi:hypothetical protein